MTSKLVIALEPQPLELFQLPYFLDSHFQNDKHNQDDDDE